MANTKQAAKRAKQAEANRQHNVARRSKMRTFIKQVREAIAAGDKSAAQAAFIKAQKTLDMEACKGLIHKNVAARTKSRLSAQIKGL